MTEPIPVESERNEKGETRCLNCRRWISPAYDPNYCVFGRHAVKAEK